MLRTAVQGSLKASPNLICKLPLRRNSGLKYPFPHFYLYLTAFPSYLDPLTSSLSLFSCTTLLLSSSSALSFVFLCVSFPKTLFSASTLYLCQTLGAFFSTAVLEQLIIPHSSSPSLFPCLPLQHAHTHSRLSFPTSHCTTVLDFSEHISLSLCSSGKGAMW